MYKSIYKQYVIDNKVWAYFFLLCRVVGTVEEKGFLAACKDKAKIQLIGWVTQKVNSIGMILCNTLRTMSILQKTEEGSVMP